MRPTLTKKEKFMMNFANALKRESTLTTTENGQTALNTTGNACLDMFGTVAAMRTRTDKDIITAFDIAYAEDKLVATKIAFWARDIREGAGERRAFRVILRHAADKHPEAIRANIALIGEYGR